MTKKSPYQLHMETAEMQLITAALGTLGDPSFVAAALGVDEEFLLERCRALKLIEDKKEPVEEPTKEAKPIVETAPDADTLKDEESQDAKNEEDEDSEDSEDPEDDEDEDDEDDDEDSEDDEDDDEDAEDGSPEDGNGKADAEEKNKEGRSVAVSPPGITPITSLKRPRGRPKKATALDLDPTYNPVRRRRKQGVLNPMPGGNLAASPTPGGNLAASPTPTDLGSRRVSLEQRVNATLDLVRIPSDLAPKSTFPEKKLEDKTELDFCTCASTGMARCPVHRHGGGRAA